MWHTTSSRKFWLARGVGAWWGRNTGTVAARATDSVRTNVYDTHVGSVRRRGGDVYHCFSRTDRPIIYRLCACPSGPRQKQVVDCSTTTTPTTTPTSYSYIRTGRQLGLQRLERLTSSLSLMARLSGWPPHVNVHDLQQLAGAFALSLVIRRCRCLPEVTRRTSVTGASTHV